jgi:CRISPR/Cas system-associated exonuclease Cas4 (RecB family)
VPSERKEEMIQRELELIDEIISTDEELSPNKPPKCALL